MADAKISALPALDAFASGDLFPVVDDPAGTPATKKATINQVQDYIEAAANTFTATQTFTPAVNTSALVGSGYSLTGSASASFMDLAGTWNTSGTPTAVKVNITDTASNASSLLMDLQVGGASQFRVSKGGALVAGRYNTAGAGGMQFSGEVLGLSRSSDGSVMITLNASSNTVSAGTFTAVNGAVQFATGGDLTLTRRAAANLRLGAADTTGTTAPTPQFLSVQSWASSTNNNQPGANFTIDGSQGTGTGAGGSIVFRVAPAGGTANGVQNALAQFAEITSTRSFNVYNTFTDASNYERGTVSWSQTANRFVIGVEAAGTGTARSVQIGTGSGFVSIQTSATGRFDVYSSQTTFNNSSGTERWRIDSNGHFIAGADNTYDIGASGASRPRRVFVAGYLTAPEVLTGNIKTAGGGGGLEFNSTTLATLTQTTFAIGGTTSSFPALKRSSTTLQARLADDSAFTNIQGKLTTDTAYTAGAPTATGYIIIYDSTGTAYRVPAVAN